MNQDKKIENKGTASEFYMRLSEPVVFRRNLLEVSKSTISILREIHNVRLMREKKHGKIDGIHHELKELKILVQKLDSLLPEYTKADVKKQFPELFHEQKMKETKLEKPKEAKPSEKKTSLRKPASEVDKLSQALSDIQKKLSSL
jgi:hypothetical protein